MKLERLISMVYMLLNHEIVSASALAEKYNVSQRTIYRDIETLCAAGIPVISYQGVNGGYGIMEEYKMDRSLLGTHDVNSIVTLLRSMSAIFEDDKAEETIHKLQSVYQTGKPNLSVDIGSWRPYNETLREIREAIHEQRVIQFEYVSAKGERIKRTVEPLHLGYVYDSWYLYAFCRIRNGYREFKLPRILSLVVSGEHFQARKHAPKPANPRGLRSHPPFAGVEQDAFKVRLRFTPACMARALDFFMGADKHFNEDGSLELLFEQRNRDLTKWLLPILLSFGDGVIVLEPLEVREAVQTTLQKMIDNYREV